MKYAVVYSSLTGNTEVLASRIREVLGEGDCLYFGKPSKETEKADLIFAGFWTDKGLCSEDMKAFLENLDRQMVYLFGTAGFGGSKEYFERILDRVTAIMPDTCKIEGRFMCQGKMQDSVRQRYVSMLEANPGDEKIKASLENFEKALKHPDSTDLYQLEESVKKIWKA